MDTLLGVYGRRIRRFKRPLLRRRLNSLPGVRPTLLDGRMNPAEWISTTSGLCKTDFEHHNFGGGELDLVDPAYDLAAAVCEFHLSEDAEHDLLQRYTAESGDTTIPDRILVYKILHGTVARMRAAYRIPAYERRAGPDAAQKFQEWHTVSRAADNFLVYQMNRFCGDLLGPVTARWSKFLFFMDLDGVLDQWLLGFPHTSWSGLEALALLRRHGISVIPNTGRSVEHVRNYVQCYGFPGGLAEFGSVFVDAVGRKEMPLIDPQAQDQLDRCRQGIQALAGVVVDSGYRFSVRAYRHDGSRTHGLTAEEVQDFLARSGFHRLGFMSTETNTYITQTGITKRSGLEFVKDYLGLRDQPVAAMGDSEADESMLQAAEFPYVPAHGPEKLRRAFGPAGQRRVMAKPFQGGLLLAAQDLVKNRYKTPALDPSDSLGARVRHGLIQELLHISDLSLPAQVFSSLNGSGR
jgi:hypothetical protein